MCREEGATIVSSPDVDAEAPIHVNNRPQYSGTGVRDRDLLTSP